MYPCDTVVPASGELNGYSRVGNSSCTVCPAMCEPPSIDSSVSFFEGCNLYVITTVLGATFGFTFLWQIYIIGFRNVKIDREYETLI